MFAYIKIHWQIHQKVVCESSGYILANSLIFNGISIIRYDICQIFGNNLI